MKIFGFEFGKKPQLPIVPSSAIDIAIEDEAPTIRPELKGIAIPENKLPANIIPVKPQVLTYNSKHNARGQFTPPEYDLAIIGRVEDTDSYVAQAYLKKAGLLFKEGYEFVGPNSKTVQYIKLRFQQIARASGIPTDELLKAIGTGLVKKSNVFLYKVRKESASGGRRRVLPGTNKEVEPIAAYFVIPAETMRFDADEFGRVRKWKQEMPDGRFKEYKPEDIVHFTFNKKEGMIFGTPTIVPVLDDVRALRRIEENIEMLIYQHLFPLFHYRVGTDEFPATVNEHGQDEIEIAKREIQYMPSEGGIVTSHRHEIRLIGAENRSLRAEGYLEHFKKRVFSGLGVSAVDMGEGECFDEHTMTLTETGWKFHWQIDHTKEKIGTYNPITRRIEFHLPNHKYEGFYHGKMIHFKNSVVDIMVTPNHEMWVWSNRTKHWEKKLAKDILAGKAGCRFMFLECAAYEDPVDSIYAQMEEINDLSALAGYVAALGEHDPVNGRINLRYRRLIGFERIAKLLTDLEIPWHIACNKMGKKVISFKDNPYDHFLLRALDASHKTRMGLLKQLPLPARKLFVSSFMQAACLYSKGKSRELDRTHELKAKVYTTQERDLWQEMAVSAGYSLVARKMTDETGEFFMLYVNLRERSDGRARAVYLKQHVKEVDYAGVIYCYNVPNHLFVTRRNGKMSIQGNTANRATSDNMSRNLVDSVKDLQRHIECQFTDYIINELLLESTFGSEVLNEENRVTLKFKEIDLDYQIKKEAHYADQFAKNVITLHEARIGQGRQIFRIPTPEEIEANPNIAEQYPEWHATFWKLIGEPKTLIQAIDEPYSAVAKAAVANRSTSITAAGNAEAADEQKEREIELEKEKGKAKVAIAKPKPTAKKKDNFLRQRFDDLGNDIVALVSQERVDMPWLSQLLSMTETVMINDLRSRSMAAFASGYRSLNSNANQQVDATIRSRAKIESRINFYVHRLMRNIFDMIKRQRIDELEKSDRIQKVKAIFDSLRYRTDFMHDVEIRKARNLGILEAARDLGLTEWSLVVDEESCGICKSASVVTRRLNDTISLDDVPPLHANSRTKIKVQ